MIRHCLILAALFCLAISPSCAQTEQTGQDEKIAALLESVGYTRQITGVPQTIEEQMAQDAELDPVMRARLGRVMLEAYKADSLQNAVQVYMREHYNEDLAGKLTEALATPTARKLIALEGKASAPESMPDIQAFVAGLETNPPNQERVVMIRQYDMATGASEMGMDILIDMMRGFMTVGNVIAPDEEKVTPIQMEQAAEQIRMQLMQRLPMVSLVSLLYGFQTVSDAELTEYIGIWESEAGKWFVEAGGDGIKYAMAEGNRRAAELMTREMEADKKADP